MHFSSNRTIEVVLTENEKDVLMRFFNQLSYHVSKGEMYEITAKDFQDLFTNSKLEINDAVITL